MTKRKWFFLLNGLAGLAAVAGWQIYRQRPRERIPCIESLYDPEMAQAFGFVSKTPQMRLIRRFVTQRAIELFSQSSGTVVDLGCGSGWLVIELAQRAPGLHVVGVDLSDEMLMQAEDNTRRAGVSERVSFRKGDAQQIPFPDGAVDMVVSTLSLHHWSEPLAVLDEVARVVRPGGAFLILDLRRDMPAPIYLLLWFAQHVILPPVFRRANEPLGSRNAAYTPNEVAQLAEQSRLGGWHVTGGPLWVAIEGTARDTKC
jgi:ubiquinone/menaquinone biosynthesis C-methylase UbiE